jgi:hypothetical protein
VSSVRDVESVVETTELTRDALAHLASIRSVYLEIAGSVTDSRLLQTASCLMREMPWTLDTLMLGTVGQLTVPCDWPYLPIVHLYNRAAAA